jgi:hypothetical protein
MFSKKVMALKVAAKSVTSTKQLPFLTLHNIYQHM